MTGDRQDQHIADAARGYHEPPPTPRDRMWARIETARAEEQRHTPEPTTPGWQRRQVLWPAAVIAALVVGVTVGRIWNPMAPAERPQPSLVTYDDPSPAFTGNLATYRQAARPVLARSETLLLQVRTGTDLAATSENYCSRALGLLAQTRLLLGSPAAKDPELAPLLEDLELALARLVYLASGPAAAADPRRELNALEEGLERKAVLPRLRNQLNAGSTPVGL